MGLGIGLRLVTGWVGSGWFRASLGLVQRDKHMNQIILERTPSVVQSIVKFDPRRKLWRQHVAKDMVKFNSFRK